MAVDMEKMMEMLRAQSGNGTGSADGAEATEDKDMELRELHVKFGDEEVVYDVPTYLLKYFTEIADIDRAQSKWRHEAFIKGFDALNRAIAGLSSAVKMPDIPIDSDGINNLFWQGVETVFAKAVSVASKGKTGEEADEAAKDVFEQMKQGLSYIV